MQTSDQQYKDRDTDIFSSFPGLTHTQSHRTSLTTARIISPQIYTQDPSLQIGTALNIPSPHPWKSTYHRKHLQADLHFPGSSGTYRQHLKKQWLYRWTQKYSTPENWFQIIFQKQRKENIKLTSTYRANRNNPKHFFKFFKPCRQDTTAITALRDSCNTFVTDPEHKTCLLNTFNPFSHTKTPIHPTYLIGLTLQSRCLTFWPMASKNYWQH